jgi:hypothetical protein
MPSIKLELDSHPIRFTPDGKIAVIDAIQALSNLSDSRRIWNKLARSHPEIISLCDTYQFKSAKPTPVADRNGWETIQGHLFDYMVEESLSAAE